LLSTARSRLLVQNRHRHPTLFPSSDFSASFTPASSLPPARFINRMLASVKFCNEGLSELMLLRIDGEKVVVLGVMLGLLVLAGQAQARLNNCQDMGERPLRCLLNSN
jgi:hypothetical protein